MYLCLCKSLKEADVKRAARDGIATAAQLIDQLGLNDEECCGTCVMRIDEFEEIMRRERERWSAVQPFQAGQFPAD